MEQTKEVAGDLIVIFRPIEGVPRVGEVWIKKVWPGCEAEVVGGALVITNGPSQFHRADPPPLFVHGYALHRVLEWYKSDENGT